MLYGSKFNKYKDMLKAIATLSRLSSDSSVPYLGYREVENIYCKALDAKNISRSDCSADAIYNRTGVGIKTFVENTGKTLQKVAEFNKDSNLYIGKSTKEIVEIVSKLRNERIEVTKRIYALDNMIYHCVVRSEGKLRIFECDMDLIDIKSIKNITPSGKNTIFFSDKKNEYSFNLSKSTLYKRFITSNVIGEVNVDILENPYQVILDIIKDNSGLRFSPIHDEKEYIILPLFSDKGGRNVPERSGLNQWNARGRARHYDEVYIPIPSWIHNKFPHFFPDRDHPFELRLPDDSKIDAKVCQDGSKALMSNPNKDLGKWILRQVMNLAEGELLTYDRLEELGLDSVVIYKEAPSMYSIDFTPLGSYDEFRDRL
ncbi:hypothetical protein [Clostridium sp.]|uniref:hypothetical protein n=1 Tax=Clostridium sp. TaxID=1506 RepID=UPI0029022495|nr:hypothetical protein [Clostridium sp.]MDU1032736.1 hypothetical protein [Clostridium sp.]